MKRIDLSGDTNFIDLIRTVGKNFFSILYFSLVGVVLGLIYTNTMLIPEYTASGTVVMKVSTSATVLNTIAEVAKSTNVAELALESLEEQNVTLGSGKELTLEYIQKGIKASYSSTSLIVNVSFSSIEEETSVDILNSIIDATLSYVNANYSVVNNSLILGEYATNAPYSGQSKLFLLIAFTVIGASIGTLIGVASDWAGGKILFYSDIEKVLIPSFHMLYTRNDNQKDMNANILRLQNNIENSIVDKQIKVIGFVSIGENVQSSNIIYQMGMTYSSNGIKTLLVDLDLDNPSLHEKFGFTNEVNVNSIVENKFFQKPIWKRISDNLSFLPAKKIIYPARTIKNPNFEKLIESMKSDFDLVLVNLSSNEMSYSSVVASRFLDCIVVNATVGQTKKEQLSKFINKIYLSDFSNLFINSIEQKKELPFIKFFSKKDGIFRKR